MVVSKPQRFPQPDPTDFSKLDPLAIKLEGSGAVGQPGAFVLSVLFESPIAGFFARFRTAEEMLESAPYVLAGLMGNGFRNSENPGELGRLEDVEMATQGCFFPLLTDLIQALPLGQRLIRNC